MKKLMFGHFLLLALVAVNACGPTHPNPPTSSDADTPTDLHGYTWELSINLEQPKSTLVEFLVDNSNSIVNECGDLGRARYSYVNFFLNAFNTIPQPLSQDFYVGIGSFGNDNAIDSFTSISTPQSVESLLQSVSEPSNNKGVHQSFSKGIQHAIDDMQHISAEEQYLVIITDGKFSDETSQTVKQTFQDAANKNISVIIGLICGESSTAQDSVAIWMNEIDPLQNADVYTNLEETAAQLFKRISSFFPLGSLMLTSKNYQSTFTVAGYYTSLSFLYWSSIDNDPMKISDAADATDFRSIQKGLKTDIELEPMNGCPARTYMLSPGSSHYWLLFIRKQTLQGLSVTVKPLSSESVEIVSNVSNQYELEFDDSFTNTDLGDWKNCFSAQLTWDTSNQGSGRVINPMSCNDVFQFCLDDRDDKLYTTVTWTPNFVYTGKVSIKVRFGAINDSNGLVWESEPQEYSIKFKPAYDFSQPPSLIAAPLVPGTPEPIYRIDFIFRNVTSSNQLAVYLVSEANLDNKQCPYPTPNTEKKNVYPLPLEKDCDSESLQDGDYVCISDSDSGVLAHTYSISVYKHVFSDCEYNQIFFDWISSEETKEVTWECNILGSAATCGEIPRPEYLPQ